MSIYPGSVATDTDLSIAKNFVRSTLPLAINNSQTTITLLNASSFPSVGYISMDTEVAFYAGKAGNDLISVIRGVDGTTATSHVVNSLVKHSIVAIHHNSMKDEIIAVETDLVDKFSLLKIDTINSRVGIGVTAAAESLELSGAILLGNASGTANGTIRYTGSDVEARVGGAWLSLTSSGGSGGVNPGVAGFLTFYQSTGSTVDDQSTLFYDSVNSLFGVGTTTPTSLLHVDGTIAHRFTTITTTTTLDNHYIVYADATAGNITVNLPDASLVPGRRYIVKKIDATANTVTIDALGGQTIDNFLTLVLTVQDESYTIDSDGVLNWGVN